MNRNILSEHCYLHFMYAYIYILLYKDFFDFLFTFINFRTGKLALVLYFLDGYFMAGSSLLGVPCYVH